jgi:copper chaperone
MFGCSIDQTQVSQAIDRYSDVLTLKVEDMTCSQCAGTIKKAIVTRLPGTSVEADPVSNLVSVLGNADLSSIKALVGEAGYTPTAA